MIPLALGWDCFALIMYKFCPFAEWSSVFQAQIEGGGGLFPVRDLRLSSFVVICLGEVQ